MRVRLRKSQCAPSSRLARLPRIGDRATTSRHLVHSVILPLEDAWRPYLRVVKVSSRPATTNTDSQPQSPMSGSPMIARTVPTLRRAVDNLRKRKATIALVPTMGALHDGHVALVRM